MNYVTIKKHDVANGPGIRVSLFVSGCHHHCVGCFNEEAWDFSFGSLFTEETINEVLGALKPDHIKGLTLLGGEPFEKQNQEGLLPLLMKVKEYYPNKNIWAYSGYLFEELNNTSNILPMIDVLVDGKFMQSLRNLKLKFRGSSNQRIIDVKESMRQNKIILLEGIEVS